MLYLNLVFSFLSLASPFDDGEQFFNQNLFTAAYEKYQLALENPLISAKDKALIDCRIGIIKSMQEDPKLAKDNLKRSLKTGLLTPVQKSLCGYALLQLTIRDSEFVDAKWALKTIGEPTMAPLYVARTWALGWELAKRIQDNQLERQMYQRLLDSMEKQKLEVVELKILGNKKILLSELKSLSRGTTLPVEAITGTQFPDQKHANVAASATPLMLSTPSVASIGNQVGAGLSETPVNTYLAGSIDPMSLSVTLDPDQVLARHNSIKNSNQIRIGILLPIGTSYTRFNHRILRALSSFLSTQNSNFSMVVRTAPADINSMERAFKELLFQDQIHALIGPLSVSQTFSVSTWSRLYDVPIFPIGPVAWINEFKDLPIIRLGMAARSQSKTLIEHMKRSKNLPKISISGTNDLYGFEMISSFLAEAKKQNVSVPTQKTYDVASSVFQDTVNDLIGPQPDRSEELKALIEDAKKKAESLKKKFNPNDVKLAPVVPFEAVFLPDILSRAKILASTFAYHDVRNVMFLADMQWSEDINGRASLADEFMNGSVATIPTSGPLRRYLETDLQLTQGTDLERQAFDAGVFLTQHWSHQKSMFGKTLLPWLKGPEFMLDGVGRYRTMDEFGELATSFNIGTYKFGRLNY